MKTDSKMQLVFRRIGQRRYAVQAKRSEHPDLEMSPAPGYDPYLPHDLMHLVVEAQLGLKRGVFGQLASGGDAGTFHLISEQNSSRSFSRARTHQRTRGKKMLRGSRHDCLQSERATYICWQEWLARSKSSKQRSQAQSMIDQAQQVRGVAGASELSTLDRRKLDEICQHLDELSAHWSRLKVGEFMTVSWPDLSVTSNEDLLARPGDK
jgi:hypothetical protein